MKKLGILALLLAVMMIITSIAVAEYTIDEYRWRYSGSTLKKGHGGKNSPHLKQYVCNVQGDVNVSNLGKCGKRDGIYGNVTVDIQCGPAPLPIKAWPEGHWLSSGSARPG